MLPEWAAPSVIAQQICSANFLYLQPWFYNHPHALRCELAVGETARERRNAAKGRVWDIFDILFENGVDAVFFDHWLTDGTLGDRLDIQSLFSAFRHTLCRLMILHRWSKYPFYIVRGLTNGEEDPSFMEHRNRVVCCVKGRQIDFEKLLEKQVHARSAIDTPISLVSFENECILSVYSNLGCDIVFASEEKMHHFFPRLKPYLLDYDMEEMLRRVGADSAQHSDDNAEPST